MQLSKDLIDLIHKDIKLKYITKVKHPYEELYIYNYTHSCQYDKYWDEATVLCRGLILDAEYNIVSRPFKKFFNFEELSSDQIPRESFTVTEKMDGSLGVMYFINGIPYISTRGSFTSEQAVKANQILYTKYHSLGDVFKFDRTYLFEIIYKQNKIVVDYGDIEDLFLLAIINNETGKDLPLKDIGFPIVRNFPEVVFIEDLKRLKEKNISNKEGYVIKFESGFRMKLKFEEYMRLHKLITQCSSKTIWENLKSGKGVTELLEKVPDEFYWWVNSVANALNVQFKEIKDTCDRDFIKNLSSIRKETALKFQTCKYPSVLFSMLDGKQDRANQIIWGIIKPNYEKPFYENIEDI